MSQPQTTGRPATMAHRLRSEAGLLGHGFARLLSLQSLWQGVKTLSWLGPLTLLIWIYAEQGQKKDLPGEVIPISVRSADPRNVYVELRMRNEESAVTADLSGPAGQLDELRRKMQGDSAQLVELTVPATLPPGANPLPVAQLLRVNPIFASYNVQIGKCTPETINVFVDQIQERDLDVKKPEALKNVDAARFDLPTVHVRAPSEVFKRSTKLEALLGEAANIGVSGEQHARVRVKLADVTPAEAKAIVYEPEFVQADFIVKENAEATFTYPSIPILTLGPPLLLNRFDVVYDQDKDTLANVKVIGPADKIAALKQTADSAPANLSKPRAILEMTGEDQRYAGQSSRTRQLKFDRLPDASIRISPDDEKREVSFHIVERPASQ